MMEGSSWVLEILTGKKPSKTSIYKNCNSYYIKSEITDLFLKIHSVKILSKYGPGKIIQALSKREDMVEQIRMALINSHSKCKQKVQIIYFTSPRLQYIIESSNDNRKLFVYVPITDDDAWKT